MRLPGRRRGSPSARGAALLLLLLLPSPWMVPALLRSARRLLCSSAAAMDAPGSLSAAFVSCPSHEVASKIARALVEQRLAACVNVVPQVTSIYEWKGKIQEDSEVLLMIKTRSSRIPALAEFVRSVHPYEVAEVIALPIQQGNPPYLRWVRETVPE